MLPQPGNLLLGRRLRWVLLMLMNDAPAPIAVGDMVRSIERMGLVIHGRSSKAVSDALRWEIRRGRAARVGRGTYTIDHLPRSTAWWIRQQVRELVRTPAVQRPSDNLAAEPEWLQVVARRLDNTMGEGTRP
jgi:hypothetical protein